MSTTTPRKRKADELETASRIPATVWGGVLDFMPYSEVRSALLVGKLIAFDAVKYVHALNIFKETEMDIRTTRRFTNIEEVNILCLLDFTATNRFILSRDAMTRVVPFLTSFPKLKKTFVGGIQDLSGVLSRQGYAAAMCLGPRDHTTLFLGLVDAFCGAFKTRAFESTKVQSLEGFDSGLIVRQCGREDPASPCIRCSDICKNFPLTNIVDLPMRSVCLSDFDRYKIMNERPGGRECIRQASSAILMRFLGTSTVRFSIPRRTDDEKSFWRKMDYRLVKQYASVHHILTPSLAWLDSLIECGFDPKLISKPMLYSSLGIGPPRFDVKVWTKSSFDGLVSRGFPLDAKDVVVVDENNEPAVRMQILHYLL